MSRFEDVVKVPEGMGPFEPEYVTVLTGRMRRPESVAEWQQQQAARLAQFKALPAGAAVIALLQAGEDFDAKAAGGQLDAWQRKCVLVELARLLAVASRDYPPAARLMRWVHGEWLRRYGAGELLRPPRDWVAPRSSRERPESVADTGYDLERLAAAWAVSG